MDGRNGMKRKQIIKLKMYYIQADYKQLLMAMDVEEEGAWENTRGENVAP